MSPRVVSRPEASSIVGGGGFSFFVPKIRLIEAAYWSDYRSTIYSTLNSGAQLSQCQNKSSSAAILKQAALSSQASHKGAVA